MTPEMKTDYMAAHSVTIEDLAAITYNSLIKSKNLDWKAVEMTCKLSHAEKAGLVRSIVKEAFAVIDRMNGINKVPVFSEMFIWITKYEAGRSWRVCSRTHQKIAPTRRSPKPRKK